ncbi:MAG: DNA-3-methyladenine glycosylase family protein [Flavobacteriales bacterium]
MEYLKHLQKDKKIASILRNQEPYELVRRKDVWLQLCYSIMSQQLSTKVADVIRGRFNDLFPGKKITPQHVLDLPFDKLRSIGLSNSKTHYMRNVCEFFLAEGLTDAKLHKMTAEEVMSKLVQIKGVGKWTVEMLLMFTLGFEDVFAVDDLGIQQAMTRLYKLDNTDPKKMKADMIRLSSKWSPYRTFACLHLWKWKDTK